MQGSKDNDNRLGLQGGKDNENRVGLQGIRTMRTG